MRGLLALEVAFSPRYTGLTHRERASHIRTPHLPGGGRAERRNWSARSPSLLIVSNCARLAQSLSLIAATCTLGATEAAQGKMPSVSKQPCLPKRDLVAVTDNLPACEGRCYADIELACRGVWELVQRSSVEGKMDRPRRLVSAFFVVTVTLLLVIPSFAQYGASIQGTVSDKSGAVVPGATVTVTNQETGVVFHAVTNDSGFYRVSALVPGLYTVKVEAARFKTHSVTDIFVAAEDSKGHDATLELGMANESVTVTADAVTLQTENGSITGSITAQDVQRLPQVGRNPYELLRLAPGIVGDNARQGTGNAAAFIPGTEQPGGASNQGIFQTENQPQISANGQRVSSNNYEIDGVSVNSTGLGGAAVVTPSEEAIREVKVVTSSYSAEDGRNVGAQIKVI